MRCTFVINWRPEELSCPAGSVCVVDLGANGDPVYEEIVDGTAAVLGHIYTVHRHSNIYFDSLPLPDNIELSHHVFKDRSEALHYAYDLIYNAPVIKVNGKHDRGLSIVMLIGTILFILVLVAYLFYLRGLWG